MEHCHLTQNIQRFQARDMFQRHKTQQLSLTCLRYIPSVIPHSMYVSISQLVHVPSGIQGNVTIRKVYGNALTVWFCIRQRLYGLVLHILSGIYGRTTLGCYPSLGNRVGRLLNCDTPNIAFGEIVCIYFLVRQEVFCSSQLLGKPFSQIILLSFVMLL